MKNLKTKDCTDNQPKKDIGFNAGDTSGSYKGSKYYIKTKGREGYVAYKAISPELELETDWNHTALQAGSKMRKLIDEGLEDLKKDRILKDHGSYKRDASRNDAITHTTVKKYKFTPGPYAQNVSIEIVKHNYDGDIWYTVYIHSGKGDDVIDEIDTLEDAIREAEKEAKLKHWVRAID